MPDETVRVNITHVARVGKAWKIDGADDAGNVRTYTMHENDRDSGAPNQPPNVGELVLFVYGTQTGEYQGKQQTTYWINEVRMVQPRNGSEAEPAAVDIDDAELAHQIDALNRQAAENRAKRASETAEPKKPPQISAFDNPMNASIEWQVCVKEAAASLRANLEWCVSDDSPRIPITGKQIAFAARQIFYGKDELNGQSEEPDTFAGGLDDTQPSPFVEPTQEQGEPERQFTG